METCHSPAYDIANDVCVANDDFVAVFRLIGICTVDVLAEGRLNSSTILKNLQTFVTVLTQPNINSPSSTDKV